MAVAVSGLDLAACDVATVGAAVELVWRCFRGSALDSLVNYCFLQGYAQTTAVGTIKTRVPSLCQRKRTCPNRNVAKEKKNPRSSMADHRDDPSQDQLMSPIYVMINTFDFNP